MILVCYDGSPDSRAAIEHAAELIKGDPAVVLTVWEPFMDVVARTPAMVGTAPMLVDYEKIDETSKKKAEETAEEGAELARAAGLNAQPRARSLFNTVSGAILAEANEVGASAIVMGSRGLTGVRSLLLGSVSHTVIQHADRAVMVVPSPEVATRRDRELREQERVES